MPLHALEDPVAGCFAVLGSGLKLQDRSTYLDGSYDLIVAADVLYSKKVWELNAVGFLTTW